MSWNHAKIQILVWFPFTSPFFGQFRWTKKEREKDEGNYTWSWLDWDSKKKKSLPMIFLTFPPFSSRLAKKRWERHRDAFSSHFTHERAGNQLKSSHTKWNRASLHSSGFFGLSPKLNQQINLISHQFDSICPKRSNLDWFCKTCLRMVTMCSLKEMNYILHLVVNQLALIQDYQAMPIVQHDLC